MPRPPAPPPNPERTDDTLKRVPVMIGDDEDEETNVGEHPLFRDDDTEEQTEIGPPPSLRPKR